MTVHGQLFHSRDVTEFSLHHITFISQFFSKAMTVQVQLFHSKEVTEFALCRLTFISPTD
jgi:hypothetical protein